MRLQVLLLFLIFSLFSNYSFSQAKDSIPAFGQIDKSDLLLKECDFDKNAEALVLFDVQDVICKQYAIALNTEIRRHIRIKILTNKGLGRANVKIPYLSGSLGDDLSIENAQSYNLDDAGNIVVSKVDKKSIVDKEMNKDFSEKIFTFPDVRAGTVIEYSYKIKGFVSSLRNWQLQTSIPVVFSRYTMQYPQGIGIFCVPHCSRFLIIRHSKVWSDTVDIFTMTNIPAFREEPYMTCESDYAQRIELVISSHTARDGERIDSIQGWPFIIRHLMNDEYFGRQLSVTIPGIEDLENNLRNVSDAYRKMDIIFRYVRKNMRWNGHSGIRTRDGVKIAWKNKTGSNGEINLILINLLRQAGLSAFPVLVSTRTNGRVNLSIPTLNQFNKVLVLVSINKHDFVLDATDVFTSPKLVPWEVQYSEGMVVDKFETIEGGYRTLWDEKDAFKDLVMIQGNIDSTGIMTGDATVTSYEYSRAKKIRELKESKEQFLEKYFSLGDPSLHIDSSSFINTEVDTMPLQQSVWFNQKLSTSGNYTYLSTNLYTGFKENPFISEQRFSDVFYGANQNYEIVGNYFIPDGYRFDAVPRNETMIMPDSSIVFTRNYSVQSDLISVRISLSFRKPVFSIGEYDSLKEFYKKLFAMLNEQVVIKKL